MDGRDIGTHVLPDATLKIYLNASPEARAKRRFDELRAKGGADDYDKVYRDLLRRDHDDSTRAASPLRKADGAVEIDSTDLTACQTAERVIALLEARIRGGR